MGNCGAATAAQVLGAEARVVAGRAGAHFGDGTNPAGGHGWPEAGAVVAGAMEGWPRVCVSGTAVGGLRQSQIDHACRRSTGACRLVGAAPQLRRRRQPLWAGGGSHCRQRIAPIREHSAVVDRRGRGRAQAPGMHHERPSGEIEIPCTSR